MGWTGRAGGTCLAILIMVPITFSGMPYARNGSVRGDLMTHPYQVR
jgi:hypothetical protein